MPQHHRSHKNRLIRLITGIILVFLSAILFTTPFYLQYQGSLEEKKTSSSTEDKMNNYSLQEKEQRIKEAHDYNNQLYNSGQQSIGADPWSNNDKNNTIDDDTYHNTLKSDEPGIMGIVSYPRLGIDIRIGHGTSDDVLNSMVGHLYGTSLPVGGSNTKSVLSAHRGALTNPLFSRLGEAERGDVFYIKVLGDTLAYKVKNIKVIEPTEFDDLKIEPGKDMVVLLTCTPYGINTHRLLVIGERAHIPGEAPPINHAPADHGPMIQLIIVLCAWLLALLVIIWGITRFKRKDKKKKDTLAIKNKKNPFSHLPEE